MKTTETLDSWYCHGSYGTYDLVRLASGGLAYGWELGNWDDPSESSYTVTYSSEFDSEEEFLNSWAEKKSSI